jgi:hypothetical protein
MRAWRPCGTTAREPFDLALADVYSVGVTLFRLLTGELPVTVSEADKEAAGDEMLAWEQRLLARVRAMTTAPRAGVTG